MRRRTRRRFAYTSTSYENGDGDEELGLLMVQTADENVDADIMTLRRRPFAAVPVVDNTILEESSLLLGVQSSTTAREPNENVDADATPHRRPVVAVPVVDNTIYEESSFLPATTTREPDEHVDGDATLHRRPAAAVLVVGNTTREESSSLLLGVQGSTTARELDVNENISSTATPPRKPDSVDNNNSRFGSKRRTPLVPPQDKKLRPQPTVAVSGLSLPVVPEWKTTVSQDPLRLHEERRRKDQVQWMSSVVDRRPLPPSPTAPVPSSSLPTVFHVSDEPNPDTFPQTSICPTHLITNSSVPSTPSSTTSSVRNVVFTPPSQASPLSSGTSISTSAGANGANPSETCVLDPWNGAPFATQDGGLDVPVSVSVSSVTHSTASWQTDASSSTFQFSVPRNAPQLPPLPTFSPLCAPMSLSLSTHSTHSNQPTSPTSPQSQTLQSPPQSLDTSPHFTPSAQHLHCVHYPASPNITALPYSEIYQQHRFASPGVMSSKLSELDFISE